MSWKDHPVYDCDTEFRFFWLRTKLSEVNLSSLSNFNEFIFKPVEFFSCQPDSVGNIIHRQPFYSYSGIMIYHNQAHYTSCFTPLCLWIDISNIAQFLGLFSQAMGNVMQV